MILGTRSVFASSAPTRRLEHLQHRVRDLVDHLVGTGEQRGWDGEVERLRGLEVDNQLETVRPLDRQLVRFGTIEDFVGKNYGKGKIGLKVGSVSHECTGHREVFLE